MGWVTWIVDVVGIMGILFCWWGWRRDVRKIAMRNLDLAFEHRKDTGKDRKDGIFSRFVGQISNVSTDVFAVENIPFTHRL